MKILPVGTKLIVLPLPREDEQLESGIFIPGTANANLMRGEVIAVSNEISNLYKKGDVILYPEKKGVGFIQDNKAYLWLDAETNLSEIWGIVE